MDFRAKSFFVRYFLIVLLSLNSLYFFYLIFTPLTLYPVYFFYKIFFNVTLLGTTIIFPTKEHIDIIFSCVAGSAYFLLFALNLSIPNIKIKRLIKMIAFSLGIFLILNIFRIIFLIYLLLIKSPSYNSLHLFFWYILSTIFIICIWFAEVKIFRIKQIPFYTDFKYLISRIK